MSIFGIGPQTGLFAFLDGSGMDPNEDQKFLQSRNPQPIDPLNQNTFDPNQYGLQVTDNTFQPEQGATLQEMLAEKEFQESVVPGLRQSDLNSLSFKYDQPQEVIRNYLGAGSPINNIPEYDFYKNRGDFADTYDPAFGELDDFTKFDRNTGDSFSMAYSDYGEEVPSLQRALGNQRFNLGQPQGIETIYQDRIMNPNLPAFASQPKESLRNIIGSQLQNAKTNVGQKVGQGMDFMGGIKDYIMGGGMLGMAAKGIGGLLSNIFQESPEQTNFKENIATDPEYQNLVNSIPGMSNYNQIFGMGSGRGLLGAIDKRLATINRTRKRNDGILSDALKRREEKLKALRDLERQKESEFLESQRRGRRPGSGGDGPGTSDSGGPTGGYSYDSGGRQGFGYGLKDGGVASMFTRRG